MMKRHVGWILLSIASLMVILVPAAGADGLQVVADGHSYVFTQELRFQLEAQSDYDIIQVVLSYQATGEPNPTIRRPQFERGTVVTIDYAESLANRPLKPFSQIEYWWFVADAGGNQIITPPQTFDYEDDRFAWQEVSAEGVSVRWYAGGEDFGQRALALAQDAKRRISNDIGAAVHKPIRIYLYANIEDMQGALVTGGREWVGGQAFPELATIVTTAAPDESGRGWMERVIPHEITHLVVYQAAGSRRGVVPAWLNEGLAANSEVSVDPQREAVLQAALDQGTLLPLQDLCLAFPIEPQRATLAYAQSSSVVRYIRDTYGADGLRRLVVAYGYGAGCQKGVEEALGGMTLEELEAQWRASLLRTAPQPAPETPLEGQPATSGDVLMWAVVLLFGFVMILFLAVERPDVLSKQRRGHDLGG